MASTERRRSLSLPFAPLFGFRSDSKSDKTPRLRRKLQKVTKSAEADGGTTAKTATAATAATAVRASDRPLTQVSDGAFMSIKYETRQPATATRPATGYGTAVSSSRPLMASTSNRHSVAICGQPQPAENTTQAQMQARTMAMVDAHERAQAQLVPSPLVLPQSAPRHYPQFHRPQPSQPSAYSFSARHSAAASAVSPSLPPTPSTSTTSTTSTRSFARSYDLPLSPPRSSSSSITPPSSACSSDHAPSPYVGGSPGRVVPELKHLGRSGTRSQYRGISGAPPTALDSPSFSASNAPAASIAQPRRKPKTPVFVIGQLESGNSDTPSQQPQPQQQQQQHCHHQQKLSQLSSAALGIQTPPQSPQFVASTTAVAAELSLLQSKSSIECIAEQYRALLASRNSMLSDAHSVQEPETGDNDNKPAPRQPVRPVPVQRRFLLSPPPVRRAETAESVSTTSPLPSPMFPLLMSRTPAPNSSLGRSSRTSLHGRNGASARRLVTPPPPLSPQTDNLSLQICLDLLTRELSSAVTDRHTASTDTAAGTATAPALQILVMIEAYERLRDQLVDEARRKRNGSSGQVEAMFSLWLQSLYKIHDSLTSPPGDNYDDDGQMSESAYDSGDE